MSVSFYQTTQRHISQEDNFHRHRCSLRTSIREDLGSNLSRMTGDPCRFFLVFSSDSVQMDGTLKQANYIISSLISIFSYYSTVSSV
jgi:hypothetical protein